ncbi:MAG: hypothetical protein ACFFED_05880 [Candidatus Thorarchaeota archaeon]
MKEYWGKAMEGRWLKSLVIKIVLVCLLPVRIVAPGPSSSFDSVLIHVGISSLPVDIATIPWALLFTAIMMTPATVFNYIQYHRPKEESVARPFVASLIFGNIFLQYFAISFILAPILFLSRYMDTYMQIMNGLALGIMAASWALVIMAIVPFIMREIDRIEEIVSPNRARGYSHIKSASKYRIVGMIMLLCIVVVPIMVGLYSYFFEYYSESVIMISYMFFMQVQRNQTGLYIDIMLSTGIYFPLSAITNALYILYVHRIIKYLQGKTSRVRCIIIGIIATFSAPYVIQMIPLYGLGYSFMPIPITLIVGILAVLLLKPVSVTDTIWEEDEKQWFQPKISSQEQTVKIPFLYLLRSKMSRSKYLAYDWDRKDEDVFKDAA